MATHAVPDASLWLPSSPFLAAKHNNADFSFPSEFPYEYGISSPPVESVAGSTETESIDEEEDFFAALAQRLGQTSLHETRKQLTTPPLNAGYKTNEVTFSEIPTKTRGLAGSPQSTLSGIGSWSGRSAVSCDGSPNGHSRVPSPATTPFPDNNDLWDAVYAAAGQVARLKMNNQVSEHDFYSNRGLLGLPRSNPFSNQVQQQCGSVWGRQAKPNWLGQNHQIQGQNRAREACYDYESVKCTRPLSLPHPSFPQQNHPVRVTGSGSRIGLPGGSSVKRGCGGTGVFLPRHHETPSEPRKKTGCAPVQLPAKAVHSLNLNIDELNATRQPRFSNAFASNYDALLARRNALLMQQRLRLRRDEAPASYEVRLPQEWTY